MKSIGARQCCQLSGKHRKDTGGTPVDSLRADHTTSFFYDSCVGGPRRPTTTYAYDKGNRLTQINDSVSGLITRTYDGLNRLTSEATPQGSVAYTYDVASRRATMTVPGQSSVVYSYDNANRLTQITQGTSIVGFGYDNANRRTFLTLPNGVLVEYGYDAASRVTGITYKQNGTTVLGDLAYEYDKADNRNKVGGSFARTGIPESVASANYSAANQQTTFGDKTLTYDENGNLQSITDSNGTTLYTWNARNQLVGISGPTVNASFVYDATGRRQKKTINGSLTEFLYDGVNPVQESSGATILANILPGLGIDEFLTRTDVVAGTTSNFLTDALGSPVAVTDNAGAVQTEYTYEPFGKTSFTGASNSSSYQYTGRENDGTGLFYYRARYYHPQLQRFISEDPIGFSGGDANLYAYVGNNPVNLVDPNGLSGIDGSSRGGMPIWPTPGPASPADLGAWLWDTFLAWPVVHSWANEINAEINRAKGFICDKLVYICFDRVPRLTSPHWNVRVVFGYNGQPAVKPLIDTNRTSCFPYTLPGSNPKCCN